MQKAEFVFLILHYMAEEVTLQCVKNIEEKCVNYNYHIVVVDNGSDNGSGERISKKLNDDIRCSVILSEINLGFARGNNLGWEYIRNNFQASFVIVMNNDVLLVDESFCKKIQYLYEREKFFLLGPDIFVPKSGEHQNPSSLTFLPKSHLIWMKDRFERRLQRFQISYVRDVIVQRAKSLMDKILKRLRPELFQEIAYYKAKAVLDPVLHGACLIYSKDFLREEKYAFSPKTFMYMEEYILHYYCQKKHYKMLYSSEIGVHHMEDVSTDMAYKTIYEKNRMKEAEMAKSIGVLIEMMENK